MKKRQERKQEQDNTKKTKTPERRGTNETETHKNKPSNQET